MSTLPRNCYEPGGCVYVLNDGCDPLPPHVAQRKISTHPIPGYTHESFDTTRADGEPLHVSRYVKDVSWAEIMDQRRERQRERLAGIRRIVEKRAILITVQYYRGMCGGLLGGWHTYIHAAGNQERAISQWCRYGIADLMERFPLMQHNAPLFKATTKDQWMQAFVRKHQRGIFNKQPRGAVAGWALCEGTDIRKFL